MFYRLRQWYHHTRFNLRTGIFSSPPVECDPQAACTVHTMVGQKDVSLYLAAIKSFLRFHPAVAVAVHSDGSLHEQDEAALRRHVPGCQVITAAAADARAREVLGTGSYLLECRGWDASYRRVIDTELWCSTPKRIIMDSDILTLRSPTEVIAWCEQGQTPFLLGQPQAAPPAAKGKKHVQTVFRETVGAIASRMGLSDRFPQGSTSGFYGCRDELSLAQLERIIRVCSEVGIPMREWGSEQCIVIYLLYAAGAVRLHPDWYLNFDFDLADKVGAAHVVHFLGFCRFYKDLYIKHAAEIVQGLKQPQAAHV
jgi:hypothetical protein